MGVRLLNERQQRFVEEYLLCGVAETAAIKAGYSAAYARGDSHKLLANPGIKDAIAQRQALRAQKTESIQDRILAELEKVAFANIEDYITLDEDGEPRIDLSKATRAQLAALNKVETKRRQIYNAKGDHIATEVNTKIAKDDKLRALQLLGQTAGMFKQDDIKVTVDVADRLLAARQRVAALPTLDETTTED